MAGERSRKPTVPGIPGTRLPLIEPELERDVRRSHPSAERSSPPPARPQRKPYEPNLSPSPFELPIKDESEHPPPPAYRMRNAPQTPPVEQASAPTVVVQGHGWKVTLPVAAIFSGLTAVAMAALTSPGSSADKLDRIEGRLERAEEDARRARSDQESQNAVLNRRLDRIETQQSVIDARIDDVRRKLREGKD